MKIVKKYGDFIKENQLEGFPSVSQEINHNMQDTAYQHSHPEGGTSNCKFHSLNGEVELYRLTSHPVVDLSQPGEHYVCDLSAVNPELLDTPPNEGEELFIITVKTTSDNIDSECSEQECQTTGCDSCVCVKDDSQCEIVDVKPFKK